MTTTGRLVTINEDAHHHEPNEAPLLVTLPHAFLGRSVAVDNHTEEPMQVMQDQHQKVIEPAALRLNQILTLCDDELANRTYHSGWGIKEWLEHIRSMALGGCC
jgi:hypothetical protein